MAGLGTIVNMAAVIAGSLIGLLFKRAIPQKLKSALTQALGLAVIAIGIIGAVTASVKVKNNLLSSEYILLTVLSLAAGTLAGELIDIDKRLNDLGNRLREKFAKGDNASFSEGFVTASLVFCVGSMAILGSLNDGISHDANLLYTKSILDGIMAMVFSSTLGIGVMFSVLTVGIYQGMITLLASFVAPLLSAELISQMSFVGSLLIMGIGLNFLYKPTIKLANMIPAMFVPILWHIIAGRLF